MKVTNTTNIPNETVREVIRFVRPPGISNFDVMLRNSAGPYVSGRAYTQGSGYHSTAAPFIVAKVPTDKTKYPLMILPYQYGQLKGKTYWIANRIEHLAYIIAHELRHLWQAKGGSKRRGMPHGARGRFSEIDTEVWAIRMLRAWRRHKAAQPKPKLAEVLRNDPHIKREMALLEKRRAKIAAAEASLKRWRTKAKRAATAIKKLERNLKRWNKQ